MFEQYSIADIFDIVFKKIEESEKEFDRDSFNNTFNALYYGTTNASYMNNFIDEVIKSNAENSNKPITIKYKDFESNSADEIKTLKKQLKNDVTNTYEIYYEYDEEGYINKAIIEDGEKEDLNTQLYEELDGLLNEGLDKKEDLHTRLDGLLNGSSKE